MRFTFCFRVLPIFLFLINSCFYIRFCVCEPRATEAALICTNRTATAPERPIFVSNFLAALDTVTPLIERQKYAAIVNGTGNLTVYAFGECMKDLDQTDCNLCFAQCKTQILRCLPFQRGIRGGRLFFDGCYLRYDDYYFFNESSSPQDRKVCNSTNFTGNRTVFSDNALELVRNLSVQAPRNDGFFVGFVNRKNVTVYGLAQCWEFVNGTACGQCLDAAVSEIRSCLPNEEGRVLNSGCYLRYSTHKFYNNSGSVATGGSGGSRKLATILAVTSSVVAFVLIVAVTIFFVKIKVVKKRRERKRLGPLLATVNNSKLNFSYKTLEKATNYFHQSNKLGQGGSGSVYKGTLPDGRIVAIKRLFFNTNQWVDHFFNEVDLISGIKHKNLAELLGCSVTGPESLLVYEYVPNQSLYEYLFVRKDVQPLSWEARYSIIAGTAEGLAFLHEESKFRIIHRDVKLSNVLLDDKLTPKIADFGLARLFPEDKTHISTGIAGTLGYMAPEYVVLGKLSEKADVYSFGVLLIEVVCGKKNNSFSQNSVSMLHMVWNLYGTGQLHEAVDPVLKGHFREDEAARLLQIGLICVQASAEVRPCMSKVVKMLFENHEIPQPTQPPFLNPSSAEFSQAIRPVTVTSSSGSYFQSSGNSMSQSYIDPR